MSLTTRQFYHKALPQGNVTALQAWHASQFTQLLGHDERDERLQSTRAEERERVLRLRERTCMDHARSQGSARKLVLGAAQSS